MKNLLIIWNVIFLLLGNVLFLNIHYLVEHNHNHETHEDFECQECEIIENSNNYFSDFNEVKFLKNKTFQFANEYFSTIECKFAKIYHSRAPPVS